MSGKQIAPGFRSLTTCGESRKCLKLPAGAEARLSILLFAARLNSHPIDEDLSMGTPVKSCPDASCLSERV